MKGSWWGEEGQSVNLSVSKKRGQSRILVISINLSLMDLSFGLFFKQRFCQCIKWLQYDRSPIFNADRIQSSPSAVSALITSASNNLRKGKGGQSVNLSVICLHNIMRYC